MLLLFLSNSQVTCTTVIRLITLQNVTHQVGRLEVPSINLILYTEQCSKCYVLCYEKHQLTFLTLLRVATDTLHVAIAIISPSCSSTTSIITRCPFDVSEQICFKSGMYEQVFGLGATK